MARPAPWTIPTLATLIAAGPALAEPQANDPAPSPADTTADIPPPAPAEPEPFAPPPPGSPGFDWVHFKNGEWLKGEIVDLQDDTLVFDSDELDELTLDLDDIHAIYSDGVATVMLRDRSVVEGPLVVEGEQVTVETDEGKVELTRQEVRSVIKGEPTELNFWSGKIGLGATVRRGNVDQTDLSATFRLQRRTPLTRMRLGYDGAYSVVEGDRTENTHKADLSYDIYLTERLFLRPVAVTYFRDEFQNIDYRITPSSGFGYELIDTSRLTWTAGAALGWQFERFIDPPPGGSQETDSAAAIAFTDLEWEATTTIDVGLEFGVSVPTDEPDAWNARTTLYAEFEIWDDLDLDVRLIWDRSNSPVANSDGSFPEQDDLRLFLGVSYDF